ncbi:hypothetical protein L0F81_25020 [Streptomyces tricolor]|uniref:4Fe-4S ferredoxin-type domain-containing protein n=1 Tax=Streptomyces tricolor TaxID=68277 RepID=A0ABS9JLS9_9ACTN|nr:hypothetical protein [Streptomyces tricolor]MCG0066505.1 hypothetical protein [Streptomyces tricolor]
MNQPDRTPADIYLTRNQLAALLAHHADVLAANLRTDETTGLPENRAGIKRAADLLDLHAEHLTAEKECTPVTELLDSILTFPTYREAWLTGAAQIEPAVQSPADRAAEHTCGNCEGIDPGTCLANPGRAAAPTDWIDGHPQLEAIAAAVWERCGRSDSGACVEDDPRNIAVAALAAMLAVLPEPVDRAAVRAEALREGADAAERLMDERYGPDCSYAIGGMDVARELRRLAGEPPANSKAPTDRAAIERAFAERLAAELAGCCTECDACIEIAQHLAGKDEPAAEERKQPPMDPVHILGIDGEPAPVAEPPAAVDGEAVRRG